MDDTDPTSTPLDLLLNAITEGNVDGHPYDFSDPTDGPEYPVQDDGMGSQGRVTEGMGGEAFAYDFSNAETARRAGPSGRPSDPVRDEQLRRILTALILGDTSVRGKVDGIGSRVSSIQVWHPTAAQKSYNKEKRLLAPPPFVRASGPISNSISSLTLSSIPIPLNSDTAINPPTPSASQTHRMLPPIIESAMPSPSPQDGIPPPLGKRARGREQRRQFKEAAGRSGFGSNMAAKGGGKYDKDREMLEEGLTFPSLWIGGGEADGKMKGFKLVLDIHAGTGDTSLQSSTSSIGATAILPGLGDIDMSSTDYSGLDPTLANSIIPPSEVPASTQQAGPWASLPSSQISIVSKPSVKSAKSRSLSSCLSENASFALWVRIHAQAVRTKYMKLDDKSANARLTSRTGQWTPFKFEMVRRAELASEHLHVQKEEDGEGRHGRVLTYGSVVKLVDVRGGTKSEAVKLVRVDKNEVAIASLELDEDGQEVRKEIGDEGQPVSELQRIGMVRIDDQGEEVLIDGKRSYLSAPGARIGGGELIDPTSQNTIWIARGKRIPINPISTPPPPPLPPPPPAREPSEGPVTPSPMPMTMPETLEEAGLGDLNDADLAHAFGLTEGVDLSTVVSPAIEEPAEPIEEKEVAVEDNGERPAKRIKTKRHALAAAVVAEEEEGGEHTVCTWNTAVRRMIEKDEKVGKNVVGKKNIEVEVLEDWMAWIIAGVECITHNFLDTESTTLDPISIPKSISPAPRLLCDPTFHPINNTLQLILSSFFTSPIPTSSPIPLSIYIGPIGPLPTTTYQSTWRSTSLKHPTRGPPTPCLRFDGENTYAEGDFEIQEEEGDEQVMSTFPAKTDHVIVVIKMPKLAITLRTMQILSAQSNINSEFPSNESAQNATSNDISTSTQGITGPSNNGINISEDPAVWMDHIPGFDPGDIDGNEAIRQALQSVSQAAEDDIQIQATSADHKSNSATLIDPELLDNGSGSAVPVNGGAESIPVSVLLARKESATARHQPDVSAGVDGTGDGMGSMPNGQGMIPLPLYLIRRDGEMIFGLGKSIVAERRGDTGDDWGLRVVNS